MNLEDYLRDLHKRGIDIMSIPLRDLNKINQTFTYAKQEGAKMKSFEEVAIEVAKARGSLSLDDLYAIQSAIAAVVVDEEED
jgi:hypothetical protein